MHFDVYIFISRFLKYARSTRKKGRTPYIDPYATVPCKQLYGNAMIFHALNSMSYLDYHKCDDVEGQDSHCLLEKQLAQIQYNN